MFSSLQVIVFLVLLAISIASLGRPRTFMSVADRPLVDETKRGTALDRYFR